MRGIARASEAGRKADTRRKIELGGLVVKAGLGDVSPALLLGALVLTKRKLEGPDGAAFRARLEAAGDAAFGADQPADS